MNQISYNVTLVYSLLVIDLLVNISDNVVAPSHKPIRNIGSKPETPDNSLAFTIYIVQIVAIITVIVDLMWHFLNVSDQVRQFAYLAVNKNHNNKPFEARSPIPQRLALKLVLDKYWWSLLVGLSYLVLTIILQIVRLDPTWHHYEPVYAGNLTQHGRMLSDQLQYYNEAYERDPASTATTLSNDLGTKIPETATITTIEPPILRSFNGRALSNDQTKASANITMNLVPTLILLVHKLVSTCYYISFVVVYRLQPNQMVHRIFQQTFCKL